MLISGKLPHQAAKELQEKYVDFLENGEEVEVEHISVAGRIIARRVFGKLAFFNLFKIETGTIQLYLDKQTELLSNNASRFASMLLII